MHLKDGEPVLVALGNADVEGSLESTRAKERRVELRAEVGGAHHEHHLPVPARVRLGVEPVELDEELQQTGLAFLRGAVHVAVESARAADGVGSPSMKMITGDTVLARLNRSLTRFAATPTNISTNSKPLA